MAVGGRGVNMTGYDIGGSYGGRIGIFDWREVTMAAEGNAGRRETDMTGYDLSLL